MNRRDRDAHGDLSTTAKLRVIDSIYDTLNRERRKPSSVGQRAPETVAKVAERDQTQIEAGIWPKYTP